MNKARMEDIQGLSEYVCETELEDFIHWLTNEPLALELGLLTEAEAEELCDCDDGRTMAIVVKAAENEECGHVYALAHRLWKWKEGAL